MRLIISCIFAAAVVVIATTILMPKKLNRRKTAIMGAYVFGAALTGHICVITPVLRYGIFANISLYTIIFLITISLGERAGYSAKGLECNCALFTVCMLASS